MAKITYEQLLKEVQKEHDAAVKYAENPADAPEHATIRGNDNVAQYYAIRAEALAFVLGLTE